MVVQLRKCMQNTSPTIANLRIKCLHASISNCAKFDWLPAPDIMAATDRHGEFQTRKLSYSLLNTFYAALRLFFRIVDYKHTCIFISHIMTHSSAKLLCWRRRIGLVSKNCGEQHPSVIPCVRLRYILPYVNAFFCYFPPSVLIWTIISDIRRITVTDFRKYFQAIQIVY